MANQFQPLQDAMEFGLKELLGQLIDGSIEDLDGPIRDIALRLSLAARRNRPDLVEMCKDQLELILLEKRLRLESSTEGMLGTLLGLGVNLLVNGAMGGLGSLRK